MSATNPNEIRSYVVVGGGTAGWMAAATLAHILDAERIDVTLVESEAIGTVGVGEATIPSILTFNNMLGIDENALFAKTHATVKAGIEFVNWGRLGERYLHPFGDFGPDIETLPLHHHWLRAKAAGYSRDLSEFAIMVHAARSGRFMRPNTSDKRSPFAGVNYALQFDATLYARFLRDYAEARGVRRIEGRVAEVRRNAESGHVEALLTDDGREIPGEFFIDCTGFRGLLIEGALEAGYEDWRNYLPVDRAVALPCEQVGDPVPYTRATAHGAGWQWRIPLQHRLGNGHVYCSEYISDDEALDVLRSNIDGAPLAEPKFLRFTTGHRRKFWSHNVVALGLSAGFMEPLESTSIHLIQNGLARLLKLMPDRRFPRAVEDEFNRRTLWEYQRIRDFLVLHYVMTERDDTPFWRHAQTLPVSDSLRGKMELFKATGRVHRDGSELFSESSWLAVLHGQGMEPEGWDPVVDRFDLDATVARLDGVARVIGQAVATMPTHAEFLRGEGRSSEPLRMAS